MNLIYRPESGDMHPGSFARASARMKIHSRKQSVKQKKMASDRLSGRKFSGFGSFLRWFRFSWHMAFVDN